MVVAGGGRVRRELEGAGERSGKRSMLGALLLPPRGVDFAEQVRCRCARQEPEVRESRAASGLSAGEV